MTRQISRLLPAAEQSSQPGANEQAAVYGEAAPSDDAAKDDAVPDQETIQKNRFNRWKNIFRRARRFYRHHGPDDRAETPLLKLQTRHAMSTAWEDVPAEDRTREFAIMMGLSMRSNPEKTPLVFEAILPGTKPPPPYYVLEDMVRLIVRLASEAPVEHRKQRMAEAFSCVQCVLGNTPAAYVALDPKCLLSLIDECEIQDVKTLYHSLADYKHELTTNTLLQFASRFAMDTDPDLKKEAMDVLDRLIATKGFNINTIVGLKISTTILSDKSRGEGEHRPAEYMQRLLGAGVQPNVIIYTALIQSLAAAGELETAWAVYDNMAGQGIALDVAVVNVLIAASRDAKDAGSLYRAMSLSTSWSLLEQRGVDLFLHTLLFWSQPGIFEPGKFRTRFQLMFKAYSKTFDIAPLEKFCGNQLRDHDSQEIPGVSPALVQATDYIPKPPGEGPMAPVPSTLRLMLVGYVRSLMQPYDVIAFYVHFDRFLRSRDPLAQSLAETDTTAIYNAVIKSLSVSDVSRPAAFDVMKDLLQDNTDTLGGSAATDDGGVPHPRPKPNVMTWTILLDALLKDRQVVQAESLLRSMREHGCQPDQATWNVLVGGYARMQNVGRTVSALRRMESAGFAADEHTLRSFALLHNRARALAMMEGLIEERKRKQLTEVPIPDGQEAQAGEFDPVELEFDRMAKDLLPSSPGLPPGHPSGSSAATPYTSPGDGASYDPEAMLKSGRR